MIAARNIVHTGIDTIDKSLASPPGCYGVIAAMPGVGKTSLMFHIATQSYMKGTKVVAMSLETPESTLSAKSAASYITAHGGEAFVGKILKHGGHTISKEAMDGVKRGCFKVGFHPAGLSWVELEASIRVHAAQGFELFMVDYFTLLEPPDLDSKRNEASMYAAMSKAAKALCGQLGISLVFVMQPNATAKYESRPDPSQLATSRQVFRDYDWGLYLWTDDNKSEAYAATRGHQFKLLKVWLHKNRLFNCDSPNIPSEPEVYVEAELRRNWFREIPEPTALPTEAERNNKRWL
jgi:replicative DNA helicase